MSDLTGANGRVHNPEQPHVLMALKLGGLYKLLGHPSASPTIFNHDMETCSRAFLKCAPRVARALKADRVPKQVQELMQKIRDEAGQAWFHGMRNPHRWLNKQEILDATNAGRYSHSKRS